MSESTVYVRQKDRELLEEYKERAFGTDEVSTRLAFKDAVETAMKTEAEA